jgi:hypothetical protein
MSRPSLQAELRLGENPALGMEPEGARERGPEGGRRHASRGDFGT